MDLGSKEVMPGLNSDSERGMGRRERMPRRWEWRFFKVVLYVKDIRRGPQDTPGIQAVGRGNDIDRIGLWSDLEQRSRIA